MNVPRDNNRISELATGFALGELDNDELAELYEALREEGDAGDQAVRLVWRMLGTTLDLRASLSHNFQDSLQHRLDSEDSDEHDNFLQKLWSRMRMSRSAPLAEVAAPEAPEKPADKRRSWIAFLLVGAVALYVGYTQWWSKPASKALATVKKIEGTASAGGRELLAGAGIDRRPLTVPTGSLLELEWRGVGSVRLVGPASVVAQNRGFSLLNGRAWIEAVDWFTVGLPDGSLEAEPGAQIAVAIDEGRAVVGVTKGSVERRGEKIVAGNAIAESGVAYPWVIQENLAIDKPVVSDAKAADWKLTGVLEWEDVESAVIIKLDCPSVGGKAKDPAKNTGPRKIEIRCTPGELVVFRGGKEDQKLTLPGAPLLDRRFELRQAGRSPLVVAIDDMRYTLPSACAGGTISWSAKGEARLADSLFHTGPSPRPPAGPIPD